MMASMARVARSTGRCGAGAEVRVQRTQPNHARGSRGRGPSLRFGTGAQAQQTSPCLVSSVGGQQRAFVTARWRGLQMAGRGARCRSAMSPSVVTPPTSKTCIGAPGGPISKVSRAFASSGIFSLTRARIARNLPTFMWLSPSGAGRSSTWRIVSCQASVASAVQRDERARLDLGDVVARPHPAARIVDRERLFVVVRQGGQHRGEGGVGLEGREISRRESHDLLSLIQRYLKY
jgi:hypothetical protein